MTWEEATERCPTGAVPACHNAKDAVTVSGAKEVIADFVKSLKAEGVFARDVWTGGIAFHSDHMKSAAPLFKEKLEEVGIIVAFVFLCFLF